MAARRFWVLVFAFMLAAGSLGLSARGAAAAEPLASTTDLAGPSLNPKPVGRTTALVASVSPATTGSVDFYDDETLVATVDLNENSKAVYTLPADMAAGSHPMSATFLGNDTIAGSASSRVAVEVGPRPVTVEIRVFGPHDQFGHVAQKGDAIWVSVWVTDPVLQVSGGSLTVTLDGSVVGGMTLAEQEVLLQTGSWSIGPHSLVVHYDPGASTDSSAADSPPFAIEISANAVEAWVSAPSHTTFYPVKDGYWDTSTVRGGRDEKASVVVRIYSSTGKLVKKTAFAARTGPWAVAWNGRTSSGALLPAGTYTVRHTVTDMLGASRTFAQTVRLSHKRLYTHTVTLTKRYTHAAKTTSTWIAWSFTLPSAPIYKSLAFSVYGRDLDASGGVGPHDFGECKATRWHPTCASPTRRFPTRYAWVSVAGNPSWNRSGRTVRLYAWGGTGLTSVVSGRVKVVYGYLK